MGWKEEIKAKAINRMKKYHGPWSNSIASNCLPVCISVLRDVRRIDKNAKIVIGATIVKGRDDFCIEKFNEIYTFSDNPFVRVRPLYHAWIELSNNEVFDVVAPLRFRADVEVFSQNEAKSYGCYYYKLIATKSDVHKFYRRLRIGQINTYANIKL